LKSNFLKIAGLLICLVFVFSSFQLSVAAEVSEENIDSTSSITIIDGTNDPDPTKFVHPLWGSPCTEDIYNVQMAVLSAQPYDSLILNGEFCFDTEYDSDSGVLVTIPLTIKGDSALIDENGISRPATTIYNSGLWAPFVLMGTDGVTICDMSIMTNGWGVEVYDCFGEQPIIVSNTYIELDPDYSFHTECINIVDFDCPVYITDNQLIVTDYGLGSTWADAIQISAFPVWSGVSNQHEVVIRNNRIHCTGPLNMWGGRVRLGYSVGILNNVLFENNVMSGTSSWGIEVCMYTSDCIIRNNDLSGLSTTWSQIALLGSNHICHDNVLGQPIGGNPWGFVSAAIEIASMNMHPPATPSWHTENNVIMRNDYRNTGLTGWTFDDDDNVLTSGCVIVYDWEAYFGIPLFGVTSGLSCRTNLVFEAGSFPVGTGGASKQVWVLESDITYSNRVVGLPPDEVETRGIGQLITGAGEVMDFCDEMLELKIELLQTLSLPLTE